jgi:hypothetical protein
MTLMMNAAQGLGAAAVRAPARRGVRGVPLPDDVRRAAEQVLGADLTDVRVYVGPEPARMGALAFTMGTQIYFAPGLYDPGTKEGLWLLGHELAHVVQQRSGRVPNRLGYGVAVVRDEALEQEADRLAVQLATKKEILDFKAEKTVKNKKLKNEELNTYVALRERGFAEDEIDAAGPGGANADFFAADGKRIWVVEVKGQNSWLSADNLTNNGNVPAKQLGNKVVAKQRTDLKGKVLTKGDDVVTVALNAYIVESTDGYESLLLSVTQLDVQDALLAFEVSFDDEENPTLVGYHPLTLQKALSFIEDDESQKRVAEELEESWKESSFDIRGWMIQDPARVTDLSDAYTARRKAAAHEVTGAVTLPQIDEDHEIRLVPVIKKLPPVQIQLKLASDVGAAARRGPRGSAPLQLSKKPTRKRVVTEKQLDHIFVGTAVRDKKKKIVGVTGYHSKARGGDAIAEGFGPKTALQFGCYSQAVRLRDDHDIVKGDGSTFFPDKWSEQDVVDAIETASTIMGKSYVEVSTGPAAGMKIFKNSEGYFPYFPED